MYDIKLRMGFFLLFNFPEEHFMWNEVLYTGKLFSSLSPLLPAGKFKTWQNQNSFWIAVIISIAISVEE